MLGATALCASAAAAATPVDRLGAGLSARAKAGVFSGVVLVARNGRPIFVHGYGVDRATHRPNRPHTAFGISAMREMFTAVAVAQLVQAGKLRFEDRVGRYLPELPKPVRRQVTIAELLDQTSGLTESLPGSGKRPKNLTAYLARERLRFTPGSRFSRSHAGFTIAALVVAKTSGESITSYLSSHVWAPAAMTHTGCPRKGVQSTGTPRGCHSTVGDLLKFANALLGNRLVNARLTTTLTTGKVASPGGQYAYGFAIRTRGHGDPPTIWHSTDSATAAGELDINPRLATTIVILTNQAAKTAQPTIDFSLGTFGMP